jgi:serine phosphatase RsbU (regulator of sigma subunit)
VSRAKTWAVSLLLGAAAVGVFGLLYQRTKVVDLERHAETNEALRRLQHLSAVSKQETLASRFNLRNHYDPLTASLRDTADGIERLDAEVRLGLGADAGLIGAIERLRREQVVYRGKVEQFKSHNSVLKNSLYYLPTAADNARAALGEHEALSPAAVDRLVQSTLVYNLLRTDANRAAQRKELETLEYMRARLNGSAAASVGLLLAHAGTVAREQDLVDPLLADLLGPGVENRIREVEELYTQRFAARSARADLYRKVLYGWSVVLLLGLVFAAYELRKLYAGLEEMVQDRTRKLDEALQELWGEMQLAKKIQTALVPKEVKLAGCDVAASMQPAESVGGDYYDVLHVPGSDWILIGDASGHGVPAGLVMMMCQTAVRTALHDDPAMPPDRLLSVVNRTLTENIRLLGEDKYMTMQALCRTPDGKFRFSGMHQDIFIYRAASGTIETIEPSGCFLGVRDEIDDLLDVRSFGLEPGDALLLYTDGITEARLDGELFDNQGLKAVFGDLAAQPAQQILDGILAHLARYDVTDDVAAIVVKQH